MIISEGYSIEEYPNQNKLVITLPQTLNTCVSTVGPIEQRKEKLNYVEKATILSIVKTVYQEI